MKTVERNRYDGEKVFETRALTFEPYPYDEIDDVIIKIQEAMEHTNLKGEINWKDGDDIEVQVAGTFAKDKFIVLKNASKNPWEPAQPHPHFDYEKKIFTKDGREEYAKEKNNIKKIDKQQSI